MQRVIAQVIESDVATLGANVHAADLPQRRQQCGRIIRHACAGGRERRIEPYRHTFFRLPNSAVPTRTQVAPSSMAASKSFDIPMESCGSPCCSASSRKRRKYGRESSWSSDHGGMVINPNSRRLGQAPIACDQFRKFLGPRAALGLLLGEFHFEHHFQPAPRLVQAAGELGGIHRLDHCKQLRRLAGFVGLQMADQVKAGAFEAAHFGRFAFEFLHVVLAELAQSQRVCFADHGSGKDLGDRQQAERRPDRARARSAARSIRWRTTASLSARVCAAASKLQYARAAVNPASSLPWTGSCRL